MKKVLTICLVLYSGTAISQEEVCTADLYDPSVYGLFSVWDMPFGTEPNTAPVDAAVLTVTNNYPVPLEVRRIVFGAMHEGSYELTPEEWDLFVSDNFALAYEEATYRLVEDPSTDHHDRTLPNAISPLPFTLGKEPFQIPSMTSRHFVVKANIPPHVLATALTVRLSHMEIRPLFPDACEESQKLWTEFQIFIPPDIPTFSQLRALNEL